MEKLFFSVSHFFYPELKFASAYVFKQLFDIVLI